MAYTGIGSRKVPNLIYEIMVILGEELAAEGKELWSGHANGSDYAFEEGCHKWSVEGKSKIFLPWKYFNGSMSPYIVENPEAFNIAKRFHPAWEKLSQAAKKLMARNSHQILGWTLKEKTEFVLCYTENGRLQGGTAQAIKIAEYYNIPVFNFGEYITTDKLLDELYTFLVEFVDVGDIMDRLEKYRGIKLR